MPFKKHFDISIRLSLFLIFIISLGLFCTNCSLETRQDDMNSDELPDDRIDGGEDKNNDEDDFNPSDFSWDDVHFLNGGVIINDNISGWAETSRITSFSMSSDGICIDHTMKNVWEETAHPDSASESYTIQGNPWIFIPLDGTIYATTYEDLRSKSDPLVGEFGGEICKLGNDQNTLSGVISNLVDHAKKTHLTGATERAAVEPIKDWYPQPDDILGFAVSTVANIREGTLEERSHIVWVRIPDYNTVDEGGEIVGRSSDSSTTTTTTTTTTSTTISTTTSSTTQDFPSSKQIPYLHDVVRRLSRQHPEALRNLGGNPFSWGDYVHNQQGNVQSMEFLDRVIQKLHSIDPRFGYIRKHSGRHDKFFGPDDIAYYEGVGNPQGKNMNEGTVFVDHITVGGNPNTIHGWVKVTDYPENFKSIAQWIYPRPGAPNYGYDPNHPGTVDSTGSGTENIILGKCDVWKGRSDASCKTGKFSAHPPHTDTEYRWTCRNIPHKTGKTPCMAPRQ